MPGPEAHHAEDRPAAAVALVAPDVDPGDLSRRLRLPEPALLVGRAHDQAGRRRIDRLHDHRPPVRPPSLLRPAPRPPSLSAARAGGHRGEHARHGRLCRPAGARGMARRPTPGRIAESGQTHQSKPPCRHDDLRLAAGRRHVHRRRPRPCRRCRRRQGSRDLFDQVRGRQPPERGHKPSGARVPNGHARPPFPSLAHVRCLLPRPHRLASPDHGSPLALDSRRGHRDRPHRACAADAHPSPRHHGRDRRARHVAGTRETAKTLVGGHVPPLVDQPGSEPPPPTRPDRVLPRRHLALAVLEVVDDDRSRRVR